MAAIQISRMASDADVESWIARGRNMLLAELRLAVGRHLACRTDGQADDAPAVAALAAATPETPGLGVQPADSPESVPGAAHENPTDVETPRCVIR
jgi:hypothetical protein